MEFSYGGDLKGNLKDAVRFLIGDTNADEPMLMDGEIEFLIAVWKKRAGNSPYLLAATAAEAIAAKLAREVSFSADGQSLGLDSLQGKYQALASQLRVQDRSLYEGTGDIYIGGIDIFEFQDPTVLPLAFGTGMHDHREAGRQDYGDGGAREAYGQWGEFTG